MSTETRLAADMYREIEEFVYREARLADESRYGEWEELVDDDMIYWIPRGEGAFEMEKHVSIIADNRNRLRRRIKQLQTGARYAQVPVSPMRRIISNIEVEPITDNEFDAQCNFVLYELRIQSTNNIEVWPGRIEYKLRRTGSGLKMFLKKVMLVNGDMPLPSLAFLL